MYKGWSNYTTWAVNNWMTETEDNARYYRNLAYSCKGAALPDGVPIPEQAAQLWAGIVQQEFEEYARKYVGVRGIWPELVRAALYEVSWIELGRAFVAGLD